MALALAIMRGGISAGAAKAINGDVNAAISAAGTTQATATALTAGINVITTAGASSGVRISNSEIADQYEIINLGANAVTVYPPTSGQINAIAANGGFTLATNTAVKVRKFTATRWMAFLSA